MGVLTDLNLNDFGSLFFFQNRHSTPHDKNIICYILIE